MCVKFHPYKKEAHVQLKGRLKTFPPTQILPNQPTIESHWKQQRMQWRGENHRVLPTPTKPPENASVAQFTYSAAQLAPNVDVNRTVHVDMVSPAELRYFQQNIRNHYGWEAGFI